MTAGAVPLAFVAGVLSILSPCVLPILPIVLGAAASEHRFGPAALAGGLSVSFVVIALFAATIGYSRQVLHRSHNGFDLWHYRTSVGADGADVVGKFNFGHDGYPC
jgi:cytochrome c biogenesis protein CcdA